MFARCSEANPYRLVGTRFRRGYLRVVGGEGEANTSLALLSEGLPSAPFAGYSDTDLRLAEGGERWVEVGELDGAGAGVTDGAGESNSFANTLGVCTLGVDTCGVCSLGIDTLGVCTLGGVGVAGK